MESRANAPALDRAAHLRDDLEFLEARLGQPDTLLVPIWRDQPLIHDGRLLQLELGQGQELLDLGGELVWLGMQGAQACFALDVSRLPDLAGAPGVPAGAEPRDLRFAGAALPAHEAGLAGYAKGMLYWHRRHRHCGSCGAETAAREGGHMRECPQDHCGEKQFPRTDPAVIVLVRHGDRCLLGRQRGWPRGMHSTLAGFLEPGETLEQAVERELLEEAGVRVRDVRYFGSQPWPFPASLMVGFTAEAESDEIRLGDDELEHAGWYPAEALSDARDGELWVPGAHSIGGRLIQAFVEGRRG